MGTSVGLEPTAHLPEEPAEDATLVELEAGLVPAEPAEDATLVELEAGLVPAEPAEDAALVELEAGLVLAEPAEDATLVELEAGLVPAEPAEDVVLVEGRVPGMGPTGLGSNTPSARQHRYTSNHHIFPNMSQPTCTCNLLSKISAIVCHQRSQQKMPRW